MTATSAPPRAGIAHEAPVVGRERSITRALGAVAILTSTAVHLGIALSGYYLIDDFAFLARAGRPDALSWDVLSEPHQGHVMPAAHLATWALQAVAPWNYGLVALTMGAGWLACLILMYRLLTGWLGTRPIALIPLVVYAVTPVTLQATTWWAAAMNALPLQLCGLAGLNLMLPLARGEAPLSWRRQLGVLACVVLGLAFFSKSVLLVLLFAGLAFAWSPARGLAALGQAWRSAPVLWVGSAASAVAYAFVYTAAITTADQPLPAPHPLDVTGRATQAVMGALLPSLAGGPISFTPGGDPWGTPPPWVTGVAAGILVVGVLLVVRGSATTRRLAVLAVAYAGGCLALMSLGRQGYIPISAGALRYFADLAIPLTLLVASLARDGLARPPRERPSAGRWAVVGILLAVFAAMSLATTNRLATNAEGELVAGIAGRSLASLAAQDEGPILDLYVPPKLLWPFYGEYALSSRLFVDAPSSPGFAEQARVLRLWDESGLLVPARVEGPSAARVPPCSIPADRQAVLTLDGSLIPFEHVVALESWSRVPTTILVSIGGGPAERWELPGGTQTAYRVQLSGDTREVTIDVERPADGACVTSVRVGALVPDEAPR